jgi:malate permease and related proteins
MRDMIVNVSGVILPIILCVLVGFGLAKARIPFDNKMVGSLGSTVGYPTLVLSHLTGHAALLGDLLTIMLASVAVVVCFGVVSFVLLRVLGFPVRAYLSPMMINNVGNVGLPVSALAFGDQGLALSMGFVVVLLVAVFSVGIAVPMGRVNFGALLRQPVIYAIILALVLMATGTDLPKPIDSAFDILGGLAIPLMLLTLGHTLATLTIGAVSRGLSLALIHLVMAAGVAILLSWLFAFDGLVHSVFVLNCMMPVSVATYLWVDRYVPDEAPGVAGLILFSTLLSVIALPAVLTFWV